MGEKIGQGQSGGVNISGSVGSVGGSIVGGDQITGVPSSADLDGAFRPLVEAVGAAPVEKRTEAEAKLAAVPEGSSVAAMSEIAPDTPHPPVRIDATVDAAVAAESSRVLPPSSGPRQSLH